MSSSETRSDSASPAKEKSLLAQVESYIKRLMKGIPVILRVEHDDGDSDDEPVTKSAICTGILNRNLDSVKFTPLKEEATTDDSKEPGIVIELQDVEKVICLNENHPSVVLVIPKYDRYVEIVSSGVEDFKAWYATLRMLCPEEGEDDSSITDDSGDASSDSYEASSPELSAKARRAMMKVTESMWDHCEMSTGMCRAPKVNALKQIITSQGRLIDALRRDRDRMQVLEVQNRDLVRVLKEREVSLDELMGVCQRLMDQQGKWVNIHLERNAVVLNPPKPSSSGKAPLALPAVPHAPGSEKGESKRPVFAPKPREVSVGQDSGTDDDSSGVDVADLDNSELDVLMSYLDDKLMMLKKIGREIGSFSPKDDKDGDDSDEEDARVDATLENVVAEEAEITKLQDELSSLQKQKIAVRHLAKNAG
ncbi:hypothetical protein Pmar_PMAR001603 [Perkinsus marinus ATCC 50983]|uniref:Uncharacterized protein n=1 Tax=Perkinsus marinus (strain ATCC 50983 / TXsc) TaxID=423536 RepID=C5KA10_PERM5|nr:hypothetical protein Pmar_PMAR001603 [Perkinsus marinus ATCC 50983]EER18683.1 hypothetical protein Pmar_PMAR001603 [Perkinsus marinus ATCC 50983]|eukprot:XP_002786887.1 hypothetical protein Pmar_PMAR001603 [Perkinsus marinus ATCC 50983]